MSAPDWVEMDSVASSWLVAVGYDKRAGHLYIEYKSGATCMYEGVPLWMYQSLLRAPSHGRWVHFHLMGWPYTIV